MAMVENQCLQISLLLTALLFVTTSISFVSGQPGHGGVTLSLNRETIPSDGYVLASAIGTRSSSLYCNTDRSDCCRASSASDRVARGHWYRPNGTQVRSFMQESAINPTRNFFYRDRISGAVRLHRFGNPSEGGRFRCEVPNAAGDMVTVYVNIVDSWTPPPTTAWPSIATTSQLLTTPGSTLPETDAPPTTASPPNTIAITSLGTATAGESYSLECIVTVTGSTDQPVITWLKDPMNNVIASGVVTTGSISTLTFSTLTFSPLAAFHAGTYTCRATVDNATESASTTVTVQNPTITVSVVSSGVATPMVGSMYSLTCTVTGAERLTDVGAMVTYQWLKNGAVVSDQTMATLSFSPLTFSDAGSHTCQATVTSSLLSDLINIASSNSVGVRLTLPRPTVIRISTDQTNPQMVRPIGSTVTLTCTADLDPAIDVPVTVNIQLRDPAGSPLATTAPSVSGSNYTTAASISSFGRNDSGVYTCTAAVSPSPSNPFISNSSSQSETLRVTTGVYLLLRGRVYTGNSVISITEIGETNSTSNTGLQCITDRMPCCATVPNRFGDWFFPNRTFVPRLMPDRVTSFYRIRGDDGAVNLNHLNTSIFMPTGLFCCVVPDALDVRQRVCATITTSTVRITGSVATPALGQSYSLTCEVAGASGRVGAYQWRRDDTVLSETGPTLSFSSLHLSDAGQYTCRIKMLSRTKDIRLTVPSIASVSVTSTPSSPVDATSTMITVICTVELNSAILESDLSLLMVSAQLAHPNGTILSLSSTMRGTTFTYTTQLNSFGRGDSGSYTCTATIRPQSTATYLTGSEAPMISNNTVTTADIDELSSSEILHTYSWVIGIAVGVVILVVGTIAAVTAITVFICWRRRSGKSNLAVSANMADGQVKLEAMGDAGGDYDAGLAARSGQCGGIYEQTECPVSAPYECPVSKPEAPV